MSIHNVAHPSDVGLSRKLDEELNFIIIDSPPSSEDDAYEMPLWIAMIGVFVLATCIASFVFFVSYKHESLCGKDANKRGVESNKEDDELAAQLEEGEAPRISMKKFNDYEVPVTGLNGLSLHSADASVDTEESSLGSGSDSRCQQNQSINANSTCTSSTMNSRKSLAERVTEPRCVLCSVPYVEGEDVAHSNNHKCHHEYHMQCLLKHWTKSNATDRKCPVCKEQFNVETSC